MKYFLFAAIICGSFVSVSQAQETSPNLPDWVVKFSNLSQSTRDEFTRQFNIAKAAYQRQDWSGCMNQLDKCENIFAYNPNVNVLRVGCLQELGLYQKALDIVLAHLKENPTDQVGIYHLSSIYLAKGDYQQCIDVTTPMLMNISMADDLKFRDLLNFRIFVCKLRLNDEEGAKEIVKGCSLLDDSPLYYMSQAALALYKNDRIQASANLKSAQKIYGKSMNMPAFERCLQMSKLVSVWDIAL